MSDERCIEILNQLIDTVNRINSLLDGLLVFHQQASR